MAKYGATYVQWAPFAATDADVSAEAYPKYGTPINLGKLMSVADTPSFNEAKIYGDNALAEYVSEFRECGLDVGVTELSNPVAAAVLGATLDTEGDDTDLKFGSEDNAPYGGLAFYICKLVDGVKSYQGIYYPKAKAAMQGETYDTKGDSITLSGGTLHFTASAPAMGKWKVKSDALATEAEAKAWVDGKITAAS